ncbi:MAG: hypothetical protein NUV91_02310, partial [Candidatus Omnitrophica bacterium]|nr:hypothetical protein [Candidatus Omnitrophota bacterium]
MIKMKESLLSVVVMLFLATPIFAQSNEMVVEPQNEMSDFEMESDAFLTPEEDVMTDPYVAQEEPPLIVDEEIPVEVESVESDVPVAPVLDN